MIDGETPPSANGAAARSGAGGGGGLLTRVFQRLLRLIARAFATVVIGLALIVGLFRLLLPMAPAYHSQIESWAGAALGVRVLLDEVDARWPLLQPPQLVFKDAALWSPDGDALLLSARSGSVQLDLAELLSRFRLQPGKVVLEGVVIDVEHRSESGDWYVLGRAVHQGDEASDGAPATASARGTRPQSAQALPRGTLELVDATVIITDEDASGADALPARISGVHLNFHHDRSALELEGTLRPPGTEGEVSFSVEGRDLSEGALAGRWQFFVTGDGLSVDAIVDAAGIRGPGLYGGLGGVTLWASTAQGHLQEASLHVDLVDLTLRGDSGQDIGYEQLHGRFTLETGEDRWGLMARELRLARNGRAWPDTSFSVEGDRAGVRAATAEYVRLDDLSPLLELFGAQGPEGLLGSVIRQLRLLAPAGELSTLRFERDTPDGIHLATAFRDLHVSADDGGLPLGVSGLTGSVNMRGAEGSLDVDAGALRLTIPALYEQPLPALAMDLGLTWHRAEDGAVVLTAPGLDIATEAFAVTGDAAMTWDADADGDGDGAQGAPLGLALSAAGPSLDLDLAIADARISKLRDFVPERVLTDKIAYWLKKAFVDGSVPEATLAFHGLASAFPFDGGEGEFLVQGEVQQLGLNYADGFPVATDITGDVTFRNTRLDSVARAGQVSGNRLDELTVTIADVREGILEYRSTTRGDLQAVIDYLAGSPYAPHVALISEAAGAALVDLGFTLPLKKRDDALLEAELRSTDAHLRLDGLPVSFDGMNGTVRYSTDGGLVGEEVEATLADYPVVLNLIPILDEAGKAITSRLEVDGRLSVAEVLAPVNPALAARFEGRSTFVASARLPVDGDEIEGITVETDLHGTRIDLPAPLGKQASESMFTRLRAVPGDDGNELDLSLSLGEVLSGELLARFAGDEVSVARGALQFGPEPLDPAGPGAGLRLAGTLDSLDLSAWMGVLGEVAAGGSAVAPPVDPVSPTLPPLAFLDLEVGRLQALGYELTNLSLLSNGMRSEDDQWMLRLVGDDVEGRVFGGGAASGGQPPPMVARFSRLYLPAVSDGGNAPGPAAAAADGREDSGPAGKERALRASLEGLDPTTVPGLVLEIDDLSLGTVRVGGASLELQPMPQGLRMPRLLLEAPSYRLDGSGEWLVDEVSQEQRASLTLAARSTDLLATLERFSFAGALSAESASLDADFQWAGPPAFTIDDRLSGELSVGIGEGQLLNVRPGAGKIFGLMSVAALPRRLELDFRDVFDKGLGFDEISGSFRIRDGQAYTSDLKLIGQTADVSISGRTGLVSRDYDQTAVVSANVGSPLPLAGVIAGGPVVGAALLIFSELFKEPLKELSRTHYRITGPWTEPNIQKVAMPVGRANGDRDRDAPVDTQPTG